MSTMSQQKYLEMLKLAHDVPNFYNNTPGKNLGYHWPNGKFSFDCWNLIKVVLAGWNATNPVGTNVKPTVTGDIDGYNILKRCSGRSKDFSKCKTPGTYLYIYSSPHSGTYVGDFVLNGKTYNVIECTAIWGGGVLYTYMDEQGYRYQYKGGEKNKYKWEEYGLLPWVDYNGVQQTTPTTAETIPTTENIKYTVKKNDTMTKIATKYNIAVDKLIAANPQIPNPNLIKIGQVVNVPVKTQQTSTSANKGEAVYHIVQKGEVLSSIAKRYNTSYLKIAALNGIANPNKIYTGQKLRVR